MDVAAHIDQLERHGLVLADAAERAGPDAAVPMSDTWDVRALLAHTGMVHRWATEHVRHGRAAFADGTEADFPAPEHGVIEWFRGGHQALVGALRAAPDDLDAMTFLANAGTPRLFWARRQAHETAIHAVDAVSAQGGALEFDADFAEDGIAELLEGFLARRRGRLVAEPACTLRVAPSDSSRSWLVTVRPDGRTIERDSVADADCTVRGTCSNLYVYLWNRHPAGDVAVTGDAGVMRLWQQLARISWS